MSARFLATRTTAPAPGRAAARRPPRRRGWFALPFLVMRRVLLASLLLFVVPVFFALAGPTVHVGNAASDTAGMTVDFDPAACAQLPGNEQRLCDYGNLFNLAGEEWQVDPRLLAAVAYVESGYAPDVIDCTRSNGALGLMQFLPTTAEARGVDPCDASSAIFGAARYLRELHDELESVAGASETGGWRLAVAGYNAGASGVRVAGGVPTNGETEVYVPRVMDKWEQYQGLFPTVGGVGGCPVAAPSGGTERIETEDDHLTAATQAVANAVIECFGRGGKPIYCYDPRTGDGGKFEHPRGRACDFMLDERERGQLMAEWLVDHAEELHVLYVIWWDRIWWAGREGAGAPWEQWRDYDGPNPHTDHVHVSVELVPGDPSWAECLPGVPCSE
jgi:hypothetical protein